MEIDAVLKEIEIASTKEYLPIIGPEKGRVLADIIKSRQPKNILEIGTLVGYSAILMGKYLPKDGKITTLEIDDSVAERARKNIEKVSLSDKIKIIVGPAQDIIPTLKEEFDFVLIDAEKTQYHEYLKLVESKLSKNAIVFADNAGKFKEEMKDFLYYVRNSQNYRSKLIDFGFDAVEVIEKNN